MQKIGKNNGRGLAEDEDEDVSYLFYDMDAHREGRAAQKYVTVAHVISVAVEPIPAMSFRSDDSDSDSDDEDHTARINVLAKNYFRDAKLFMWEPALASLLIYLAAANDAAKVRVVRPAVL